MVSWKGKIVPEDVRRKISQSKKGQNPSEETKKRMSESHKGKSYLFYWKGKTFSDEHKRKIAEGNKGKVVLESVKKKISETLKRHSFSQETIEKIRQSMKGRLISEETRRKMSESHKKNPVAHWSGKHFSEEHKKRISSGLTGRTISEKAKEIIRQKRLHRVYPAKDTQIEVKIQEGLREIGINFEKHKAIMGQPDIFIEPKMCVFVDGCYWHGCEECFDKNKISEKILLIKSRDIRVTQSLQEQGYKVLRFWEHEIKGNLESCITRIKDNLQTKSV